ncbi:MAG: bis(5'-nucleosyl)-tetraphosphatase (symmetrical) YqeK [Dehalococcoidia bacterium]
MKGGEADSALVETFRERTIELPDWLRGHIVRVVHEARRLAHRYELDAERVEAAAWGHDLYRAHDAADLLRLAEGLALPVSEVERAAPILLHGPVAAATAEREWGVGDREVLEAIQWHTTARAGLSPVATTVFLADKIEPAKVAADAGLWGVRTLADHDPEAAMLAYLERQLATRLSAGEVAHPASLEARNALLLAMKAREAPAG